MSTPVHLYRYDLTGGMARAMSPMLIGRSIEGIWHTSIVVYGHEFFFDGGVGIVRQPSPGTTHFGRPYRTEQLGSTSKTESEFMAWVMQRQRDGFGPNDYNLLENNCNSFSQAAARFLLNQDIPADVKDMIPMLLDTPFGRMIRPTLEQATHAAATTVGGGASQSGQPPPPPLSSSEVSASSPVSPGVGAGLLNATAALSESQADDLLLARTMLESNELLQEGHSARGVQVTLAGVETLKSVLVNILEHPSEAKYRALSIASKTYTEKLRPLEEFGVTVILETAGFTQQTVTATTPPQVKWVLADKDASRAVLQAIVAALEDVAENIETLAAVAMSIAEENGGASGATPPPVRSNEEEGREGLKNAMTTATASQAQAARSDPSSNMDDSSGSRKGTVDSHPTTTATSDAPADDELLRFCDPPFPPNFTPLAVGQEGGMSLFSICINSTSIMSSLLARDAQGCFGKCSLSSDHRHMTAYYCSRDGKEKSITKGYKVLCVRRGCEASELLWVPASLLTSSRYNPDHVDVNHFLFHANGTRFGVARAALGSGVHAGCREPAGRCVVPYGGRAETVTATAEVLCIKSRVPAAMVRRVQVLADGDALLSRMQESEGVPLDSFDALLAWDVVRESTQQWSRVTAAPVTALRCRKPLQPQQPRLLVCHDMAGGYPPADRPSFFFSADAPQAKKGDAPPQPRRETVVDKAYTVSYWALLDVFVYFSHHRVTVPPRSWVEAAHRHGLPVLGTIITEGNGGLADLKSLLTDVKRMGSVIQRLAELCSFFCFDGYLINIENSVTASMAKRLVIFTEMLRKRVQSVRPHGQVIWYDAVTIDGSLQYQNALTAKNKPFFDVSDGIFTNYFWNPMHLSLTRTTATSRPADVYVGVDVFGRRMFGGGGYNTHAATQEAVSRGLSVALFAPGWTCECEGHGRRENFLRAEAKLWSRLQVDFKGRVMACKLRPRGGCTRAGKQQPNCTSDSSSANSGGDSKEFAEVDAMWTSFATGLGTQCYINGVCVVSASDGAGYCQPSAAHFLPPFRYEEQSAAEEKKLNVEKERAVVNAGRGRAAPAFEWSVRLPLVAEGGRVLGGYANAHWRTDAVWFGDQSISVTVPPSGAVRLADWCVTGLADNADAASQNGGCLGEDFDVVVDLAVLASSSTQNRSLGLSTSVILAQRQCRPAAAAQDDADCRLTGKAKQLLCVASDAEEVRINSGDCVADGNADQTKSQWSILRFNLSAAAARSSTAATSGRGETAASIREEYLAELNAISLLNTAGSASLVCTVGGLAVHMMPKEKRSAQQRTASEYSPLVVRRPVHDAFWPSFTLHPCSRSCETVLELHNAGAVVSHAVKSLRTGGAKRTATDEEAEGTEAEEEAVSVAIVATVSASCTETDETAENEANEQESAVQGQKVFLGVHRVVADAASLCLRLNTEQPTTTVRVHQVAYYIVANGY